MTSGSRVTEGSLESRSSITLPAIVVSGEVFGIRTVQFLYLGAVGLTSLRRISEKNFSKPRVSVSLCMFAIGMCSPVRSIFL